jgi:hypothetical protein
MTISGWVMMSVITSFMTGLLIFCTWKVVTTPESAEHIKPPLELDNPDTQQPDTRHSDTQHKLTK